MHYIFCGFSLFWFQRHTNISGKLLQAFRLNVFRWFFSLSFFSKLSLLLIEPQQVNSLPVVTVSSSHCLLNIVHLHNALHWVPLTTSSVRTKYRLQRADLFASKLMTSMLKTSVKRAPAYNGQFLLYLFTRSKWNPMYMKLEAA